MLVFTLRRLVMIVPVLLGVTLLTFAIAQVTPGDPVQLALGTEAEPDLVEEIRDELGLNDPLPIQYGRFVVNAAQGDLGTSIRGRRPVLEDILIRVPVTLKLTTFAMLLAIVFGVTAGTIAATTKSKLVGSGTMALSLVGLSIPNFWLAIIFIIIFGVQLKWVSVTGGDGFKNLILPAVVLALVPAATLARMTRSSILEVLNEDYVRTAYAKGLGYRATVLRHVLRNGLIPVVTVTGLQIAVLLGGAVFIESVFALPGLGRFAIQAIGARDYPQIQGIVLFTATVYVLINLLVDLLYGWIDPRIRVTG